MRFVYIMTFVLIAFLSKAQQTITLQEAFSIAVRNNPFYKVEKYNYEVAKTAVVTAGLRANPTLSISSQAISTANYFSPGTGFYSPDNRQASYQLSKTLQINGQLKYKIENAKSELKITETNLQKYEWELLAEVAQKWLDVWYAEEKLKLIQMAKTNSDSLVKINQIRLKNQVITNTEFTRTQINDEQYKLMLLSANQEVRSEMLNLSFLLGLNDSVRIRDQENWFPVSLPVVYDSLLQIALKNRLDIQISQKLLDRAHTDESLQKALAKPQPELGLSYSPQNRVPYLGLSLAIPLPLSDRNQGEIKRARIMVDQADANIKATLLQVVKEVRNSLDNYLTSKKSWEKYRELNHQSEQVLQIVKMSYLKGGTTILDYLEAERMWFDMQSQYFQSMYNYRKSYQELIFTCQFAG